MVVYGISLGCGIIVAIAFMRFRVKGERLTALLLKAFASSLFVLCGASAAASVMGSENFTFAIYVIAGLVFGLMGDIWLDLKWMYPPESDMFTVAGFGAFAVGHLFFISGLLNTYGDSERILYVVIPFVLAAVIAVAIILLEKPMKMVYGKFKGITAVYAMILVYMTLLSGSLALMNSFKVVTLDIMFAGGVFFLISDLILSGTYFGEGKNRPVDIITNHATYYIAQFLIASAIMFI